MDSKELAASMVKRESIQEVEDSFSGYSKDTDGSTARYKILLLATIAQLRADLKQAEIQLTIEQGITERVLKVFK